MRLKSYFAGTVEAAMALAREELGPDAMLVQSKRTSAETRRLGHYEVVFAVDDATRSKPPHADPPKQGAFQQVFAASPRESQIDKLTLELEQLKTRVATMPRLNRAEAAPPPQVAPSKGPDAALRTLLDRDVDAGLAEQLARASGAAADPTALRKHVEAAIRVDATLGAPKAARKTVALVGPPGAGKTTAIVKLVTRYGLAARRPTHLISSDVFRVGGPELLRVYASILGIDFQVVETPRALAQALEQHRGKDFIFIDTPAWNPRDAADIQEFATYMSGDPAIDVQLVLPASHRSGDLACTAERYASFKPRKLLFTHVDATTVHGAMLNTSHRTGKPISFLSSGELVPEDLEPATEARIADLVLGTAARESATASPQLQEVR